MITTHFPRVNRLLFIVFIAGLITTLASIRSVETATPTAVDTLAKTRITERFGSLPLSFEANEGQVDQAVKFLSRGLGYDLFLSADEAVLSLRKPSASEKDPRRTAPE